MTSPTTGSGIEFLDEPPAIEEPHVRQWEINNDEARKNLVIDEIMEMLGDRVEQHPTQRFRVRLVVDEAVTNAVAHGCPTGDETVRVDFFRAPMTFVVRVNDNGPGFKKEDLADPTEPGNELREHGRGVFIMERYSQRLAFSNGGREVTVWMSLEEQAT